MSLNRLQILAVLSIIAACCSAPLASAADYEPTQAERIRDDTISRAVAWRPKSAETALKKADGVADTQPFKTAEAFLMASYGINNEQDLVTRGVEILATQAERDPKDPIAQFYLGEVLWWLDKPAKAKAAWSAARDRAQVVVDTYPRYATGHFYLGASLVRLKKYGDARKALKKAERLDFDPPMVNFQMGLAFLFDEKWKPAKDAFDAVHEVDPRYAHLYFYRGIASDKLGRKDELINDMAQFVKLAPNAPEASKARAILSAVR